MNTLTFTLSPDAWSQLAGQATQNGTFVHSLSASDGAIFAKASLIIEQCGKHVYVQVRLENSVNTITLVKNDGTGRKLCRFVEELANGVTPSSVPKVNEHLLMSDLESMLREAIRLSQGTYYLPADGIEHLCLLLQPSSSDPTRTVFRFELDSVGLTLPLLLPSDRMLAYELLSGCVHELIANYRCAA